jgi:hypothetical protein
VRALGAWRVAPLAAGRLWAAPRLLWLCTAHSYAISVNRPAGFLCWPQRGARAASPPL